jgi:hypothetical protein
MQLARRFSERFPHTHGQIAAPEVTQASIWLNPPHRFRKVAPAIRFLLENSDLLPRDLREVAQEASVATSTFAARYGLGSTPLSASAAVRVSLGAIHTAYEGWAHGRYFEERPQDLMLNTTERKGPSEEGPFLTR